MFNGDLKIESMKKLKLANNTYQSTSKNVASKAETLHKLRINSSQNLINDTEIYINYLANSPKEFDKSVNSLKISFKKFDAILKKIEASDNVATVSGTTSGAGVVAGAGVAAFGPSAAIAIATTFGTASTGTAISALSGAAATNAALAWLGGGAIAASGGGMAAGNALLALSGPVGWAIGGSALIGGALWARKKNKKIANEANKEAIKIEKDSGALRTALIEINQLFSTTKKHSDGAAKQLKNLKINAPENYLNFTDESKNELGALINNINSLSKLLVKNIG